MSKISELSDGGVVQGGDTLIAVRSGGNVKVTYGGSTTANIDGGTIDDTVIGGTTAAAGTFTTGQFDTSVNVDGTVTADGLSVGGNVTIPDKIIHSGDTNTAIRFPSANTVTVETAGSEAMRIDSSGNVGIGVAASDPDTYGRILQLHGVSSSIMRFTGSTYGVGSNDGVSLGFNFGGFDISNTRGTGYTRFMMTGGEAMRITSSGNLLVGKTVAGDYVTGVELQPAGAVLAYRTSNVAGIFGRTDAGETVRFTNNSAIVGTISTTASTTAYNTSSDYRLKENITDAPAGNVDDIKVRSFDWKADGSHQEYGMVAQELESVAPYAVTKGETENDMWSVDYSKLVPMLIKEVQDLKAEVAALKGAN